MILTDVQTDSAGAAGGGVVMDETVREELRTAVREIREAGDILTRVIAEQVAFIVTIRHDLDSLDSLIATKPLKPDDVRGDLRRIIERIEEALETEPNS